ncbi:citramalate synthase [Salinigranum rubrum]|uniref:Citramalate synthase n=1 Tax=Salinigranum rubrum TaxID=755307 RepID=A0A2I8VHH4_9EURY|nr:LeuA family protein [Salinigranum rubrum]AUV81375.1 citramalate synthase [Salinigranum rubrum]
MQLQDVTVREGGQMPGRSYGAQARVDAARALDRLGIEYVQVGFAAAGDPDAAAIERVADECDAAVVSIARALPRDVEAALDAGADVVEVFGPLSDLHLEHTVGKTRDEMLTAMRAAVDAVHDGGATPTLTFVDAFRTPPDVVAGATARFDDARFVSLADTVGTATPRSVRAFLDSVGESVDLSRVGVHLHDDLGCATANALVAADRGVGRADVSVASLGERAGNTALEELVVAAALDDGEGFGLDSRQLVPVCRDVLDALDESVDPRKAVLGEAVHEHESPIHVAAMLEEPSSMEPYEPARFGGRRTLVFGANTGRGGARRLLERAGRDPSDERVERLRSALADEGPMGLDSALDLARRV